MHTIVSELRAPPYWANYGKYHRSIHGLVTSKYFDLAIAGVIGLNVVTMAMEFYMMPDVRYLFNFQKYEQFIHFTL